MLFLVNEERAVKMGEKLKMSCFALDKGAKYTSLAEALEIKVPAIDLLPTTDVLQALSDGKVSKKKVIKKGVKVFDEKSLKKGKEGEYVTNFYLLLSIVLNSAKTGTLTVLIKPEDEVIAKFSAKYLSELFGKFGIKLYTDDKKGKKVIKALGKGKKKTRKANVRKFISKNGMSSKGIKLYKQIRKYYNVEVLSAGLDNNFKNGELYIKQKGLNVLREAVVDAVKNDKKSRKAYDQLRKVEAFELPSAKKLKKKLKRKMSPLVIRHMAIIRYGIEFGSKEYYREMDTMLTAMGVSTKVFKEHVEAANKK